MFPYMNTTYKDKTEFSASFEKFILSEHYIYYEGEKSSFWKQCFKNSEESVFLI